MPRPRVRVALASSLDGYIATADGGVAWLEGHDDAMEDFGTFLSRVGSVVMGRATWDFAASMGQGGGGYAGKPTWVLTSRPFDPPPGVRTFEGGAAELLREIEEVAPGGDVWLMGGGRAIRPFHEAGLVDTWEISVIPTVLGGGIPLFPPTTRGEEPLTLLGTRTFKSGVVELRYAPRRAR